MICLPSALESIVSFIFCSSCLDTISVWMLWHSSVLMDPFISSCMLWHSSVLMEPFNSAISVLRADCESSLHTNILYWCYKDNILKSVYTNVYYKTKSLCTYCSDKNIKEAFTIYCFLYILIFKIFSKKALVAKFFIAVIFLPILIKNSMNANKMKTNIFLTIKYDLKIHQYSPIRSIWLITTSCDVTKLEWNLLFTLIILCYTNLIIFLWSSSQVNLDTDTFLNKK